MNRIELRGVIVPSMYDTEWAQDYITRGIITPESTFRRSLAAAGKAEPLTVCVNSPGGSVFSAYEMINALQTWKAETKQPVHVIIGAMAASAASALAIMAGTKISAHSNSKMMFHGAVSCTEGGQGAHEDNADLIGKINTDIMTALTTRCNINPDTVAGWFAEGRAGWLTAQEMLAAGIISEIVDAIDAPIVIDPGAMAEMDGRGLQIAAMLEGESETETTEGETSEDEGTKDGTGEGAPQTEGSGEGGTASGEDANKGTPREPGAGDQIEDTFTQAQVAAAITIAVSAAIGAHGEKAVALMAKLDTSENNLRAMQSHRDRLETELKAEKARAQSQIINMQTALEKATDRIGRFLSAAATFSPEPTDWLEALKLCDGSHAEASRRFGHLRAAYNNEQKAKREAKR